MLWASRSDSLTEVVDLVAAIAGSTRTVAWPCHAVRWPRVASIAGGDEGIAEGVQRFGRVCCACASSKDIIVSQI
jgi:hypothetical protein